MTDTKAVETQGKGSVVPLEQRVNRLRSDGFFIVGEPLPDEVVPAVVQCRLLEQAGLAAGGVPLPVRLCRLLRRRPLRLL